MKKALVTGGMGFVGGHLVKKLLAAGMEVTIIDKSTFKPIPFDLKDVRLIDADLQSNEILKNCLMDVDVCYHLAALSSLNLCSSDWLYSHQNNVITFNSILDIIKNTAKPIKLVYASSSAVYGDLDTYPLNETMKPSPISTYGADKLSNEIYAKILSNSYGINSLGLRLFNVYGPGQSEFNPESGVITLFKHKICNNKPIVILGTGEQTRDFIFVEDVAEAFLKASMTPYAVSGVYNICTGKSISIKDLALTMIGILNKPTPIEYKPQRLGDALHSLGDGSLARETFDFVPQVTMEEGLRAYLM